MQQAMRSAAAARIVGLLVLRWRCPDGQEYGIWLQVGQMLAAYETLEPPQNAIDATQEATTQIKSGRQACRRRLGGCISRSKPPSLAPTVVRVCTSAG